MIDIVFQLLVFFILTFKIVVQEGDFNIKMPLASADQTTSMEFTPPIEVTLSANEQGQLVDITVNDLQSYGTDFRALTEYIKEYIGQDGSGDFGSDTEVEFDCDGNLKYSYVIQAITSVSGYRDINTGDVIPLVEKIKFKDLPSL